MAIGSFVLMLHSHLPFYRKAGMWPFGEENLYECMAETYIPLLNMLNELVSEGIQPKLTLGITPILAEQLADDHLQEGFIHYISQRIKAANRDLEKYTQHPEIEHAKHLEFLSKHYLDWFTQILHDFEHRYNRNLLAGFRALQDQGVIEITTSCATHGFLPLLGTDASIQAQLKAGIDSYKSHFGQTPKGVWLPECAYRPAWEVHNHDTGETTLRPAIETFLFENDLQYFFTEYHAIEGSTTSDVRRIVGVYEGLLSYEYIPTENVSGPTGLTTNRPYWMKNYPVAVMGRNDRASFQVWSASHGYPGDGLYREFHKKDGESGLHYWRLTSKECPLGDKMLYDPIEAQNQTQSQAEHFVGVVHDLAREHMAETGEPAMILTSFDTELFGHWWFEGITWLKHVLKAMDGSTDMGVRTGSEALQAHPPKNAIQLPESTWGQGGHYWVWNNTHTDWMWPIIHQAEYKMQDLASRFGDGADNLTRRALNQALRELLLLESSDWPFLVTTFQAKDYAIERFEGHQQRFWQLANMIESGQIDEAKVTEVEGLDNPFPTIDYTWFQNSPRRVPDDRVATVAGAQ